MGEGGWFVYNEQVSWCTVDKYIAHDGYYVEWQGQPVVIEKSHRFPTMLAAQLFVHRDKAARYVEDRKSDVMFYQELSRRFEEEVVLDVELHAKAWFVRWPPLTKQTYMVEILEWRPIHSYTSVCEVLDGDRWFTLRTEDRFKTKPGARFYAEAKLLEERIKEEERLYVWLKDFGERADEHGEEVDKVPNRMEEA